MQQTDVCQLILKNSISFVSNLDHTSSLADLGGTRGMRHHPAQNSFILMQFLGKIGQILGWYPLWEILDPPLKLFSSSCFPQSSVTFHCDTLEYSKSMRFTPIKRYTFNVIWHKTFLFKGHVIFRNLCNETIFSWEQDKNTQVHLDAFHVKLCCFRKCISYKLLLHSRTLNFLCKFKITL